MKKNGHAEEGAVGSSESPDATPLAKPREIDLVALFEDRLPQTDREVWSTGPKEKPHHLWKKFDDFLIEMAGVMGTKILDSVIMRKRLAQWEWPEPDGLERLQQFSDAIIRRSRVGRGAASHPIKGTRWRDTKKAAVPELRAVLSRAHEYFRPRHRAPEFSELRASVMNEIASHPEDFPFLTTNASGLGQYLLQLQTAPDTESSVVRRRLVSGNKVRPEKLFDLWGAWATNHSPETFRVLVSKAANTPNTR